MPLPITRYELDITGKNKSNLVEGEIHTLSSRDIRAAATKYGPYFGESLIVYDNVSNTPLTRNKDYICSEIYKEATLRYGKEIYGVVLILNKNVSSTIRLTYQVLGGKYSNTAENIVTLYETAMSDNRPVEWNNVLNKPYGFKPSLHQHLLKDVVGFEVLVDSLDRLGRSITLGNLPAFEYLIEHLNDEILKFEERMRGVIDGYMVDKVAKIFEHIEDKSNPHEVNKESVGLDKIENLGIATEADLQEEYPERKYVTLDILVKYIRDALETVKLEALTTFVKRDERLFIRVNTSKIEDGRELYWKIDNISTTDECFTNTSGKVIVYNDRAEFSIKSSMILLGREGMFNVSIYKKEGDTKYLDRVTNLTRSDILDDKAIDTIADPSYLRDEATAESLYLSVSLYDYNDAIGVQTTNDYGRARVSSDVNIDKAKEALFVPSLLKDHVDAEGLYMSLANYDYNNTTSIGNDNTRGR